MTSARRRRAGDPAVAVGYLRVSTDDQNIGLEAQREAIGAWAAKHSIKLASIHEDRCSGGTGIDGRPGLSLALDDVRASQAGILVALRRDRWARDPLIAATLEVEAGRRGAVLRTVEGAGDGDSPSDVFLRGILDNVASFERALIRSRTSSALRTKQRKGEAAGGRPPYGWRKIGKALEPVDDEQRAITVALSLADEGQDCEAIARALEAAGYPPRGQRWHRRTVHRLLARARAGDGPPGPSPQCPQAQ